MIEDERCSLTVGGEENRAPRAVPSITYGSITGLFFSSDFK
jgi:hypothetical protein